jgi:hypothetical protein
MATGLEPEKSQLTESRQYSVEDIARWFRVPPHKIGHLLRATFSNIEQQDIEFVRGCLRPWCRRLEQEAQRKLFRRDRGPTKVTLIDTRELVKGDAKSRADYYASGRQNGWLNANEIRAEEGYDEIGSDGDVYLANSTLAPVKQLLEPPKPPAPKLPPGAAPGKKTGAPEEPSDGSEAESDGPAARGVARNALTVILVGALKRFAARLANRRTSLSGRPKAEIEASLTVERERQLERLHEEVAAAAEFAPLALGRDLQPADVDRAVELVGAGEMPKSAVLKALPETCPRPG